MTVASGEKRFSFGENWADYVDNVLDETRIQTAKQALQDLLGLTSLEDQSFLDIGCGSGLHSLAAYHLGASQITSFDYDLEAVHTTEKLKALVGNPEHWQVFQGSILDDRLVAAHQADIVYSWGVLHHTGEMWTAIRHAAHMAQPGGLFCIAIYNKVEKARLSGTSVQWQKIKRMYVNSPTWKKRLMLRVYKTYSILMLLRWGENPVRYIREYGERGMNWHNDAVDWIGGYPFEFASADEIIAFCEHELQMKTLKAVRRNGHSNNEFVFRAHGSR
jgi:2-polyprenyl-3-methyl-5-hydroxy-6-metoxy-1,4-benzoquinol methylase